MPMKTAELLFNHNFHNYGLPEDVVSDPGPQFVSWVSLLLTPSLEHQCSRADKADDPTGIPGMTAMKSRERLVTAFIAITGQADSSATAFLTVTGQNESSEVGATIQSGAKVDTAASGGSVAEATTSGGT